MPKSIVIIPTYNEIENIRDIVEQVLSQVLAFDLLIVDDSSPDGTGEIVKDLQNKYPQRLHLEVRKGKLGLGTAYIHGFKYALAHNYDYIFEMDADFSHNPADLAQLYQACEEGHDLVIGSRYIKGVNVINWPMHRVLMSYFASFYVRKVTGMHIMDATAGFKCYRREVLETIPLDKIRFVGYAFQIQMKFEAWKYGFKIKEIPIVFTDRTRGQSKMSVKIFREAFWGVFQMKIRSFFKKYRRKINQNESSLPVGSEK